MKRFAIAALILLSVLACTKSNIQYEPTGEISLRPVAEKATKAAHTTTAYGEGAPAFNVWAWWADVNPGAAVDTYLASNEVTPYISDGEFVHRGSGSWGGSTPYYWPTRGSLVFAGYSPSQTLGGTFDYDVKTGKFTAKDYVQSHYIDQTVDLMWFDRTKFHNTNDNVNGKGQTVNGVPVVFHHALSWLEFRVVRKADVPANWLITELDLTGIETKADFDSKADSQWTNHSASSNIRVWNGSYLALPDNPVSGSPKENVLESTPNGVVVIPQTCTDGAANLVVTYNLKKYDGTDDSWLRAQTVTLPLTAGTDGNAWLPGKKYVYTIVFGNNEIRISPTVQDWDDGGNVEIEAQ
ncbi:MAG: fimbrillin family protein [Bacteroidales bacterium]|nr:fimbrillin family protein [Bacteroidales bacterium]